MRCLGLLALALLLCFGAAARAEEAPIIGELMEIEGTATLHAAGGEPQPAAPDMPVRLGDRLETGADSRAMILFIDETEIVVSGDTSVTIDEYVFDPDDAVSNKAIYSFGRGVFQYVSGLIAKKDDPDVTLKTPTGQIGIRGTTVWGGEIDGEYGVFVEDGFVTIETDKGETWLRPGEGAGLRGRAFAPGPAHAWTPDKIERARDAIRLQRRDMIRERIRERQDLRLERRENLKSFMKERRRLRREH